MKRFILGIVFIVCFLGCSAQQILVMENVISLKNFKYYTGNRIILKISGHDRKIHDEIIDMTDSTLVLDMAGEIGLDRIVAVYKENWLIRTMQGLSLLGGTAYLTLDSFNRLINKDYPVVLQETLIISGGMVAFSFALIPLKYRKYTIGEKWKFRVIRPL